MNVKPSAGRDRVAWRGVPSRGARIVAAEVPVAFVYDGGAEAVMMATPADLEDFALGFSLNDGVVATPDDITEIGIVEVERGIELRIALKRGERERLITRRRRRAGPVGCGLCGVESIAEAMAPLPKVAASLAVSAEDIVGAMAA